MLFYLVLSRFRGVAKRRRRNSFGKKRKIRTHRARAKIKIKTDKAERKRVQPPALLCELHDKLRWWVPIAALEPAVLQHLELLRVNIRVAPAPAGYAPQRERRLRARSTRRALFYFLAPGAKLPELPLSFLLSFLSLSPPPLAAQMVVRSLYPSRIRRCCRCVWPTVYMFV